MYVYVCVDIFKMSIISVVVGLYECMYEWMISDEGAEDIFEGLEVAADIKTDILTYVKRSV